jgi:hypothetical protein
MNLMRIFGSFDTARTSNVDALKESRLLTSVTKLEVCANIRAYSNAVWPPPTTSTDLYFGRNINICSVHILENQGQYIGESGTYIGESGTYDGSIGIYVGF